MHFSYRIGKPNKKTDKSVTPGDVQIFDPFYICMRRQDLKCLCHPTQRILGGPVGAILVIARFLVIDLAPVVVFSRTAGEHKVRPYIEMILISGHTSVRPYGIFVTFDGLFSSRSHFAGLSATYCRMFANSFSVRMTRS